MTGPSWLTAATVGPVLVVLAVVIVVDKRRPMRQLDDKPATEPDREWLGDGDLNRWTDERIAAEHNLRSTR